MADLAAGSRSDLAADATPDGSSYESGLPSPG
jgi:hypothetical protein